jgi:nucleotide-binding universal stress UspA family protein
MPEAIRTILVPYDFSPPSREAFVRAEQLAQLSGASIHLLHVVNSPMLHAVTPAGPLFLTLPAVVTEGALLEAEEHLRQIASRSPCHVDVHVCEGLPTDVICELAEKVAADLIVMGTHGREGFSNFLLGSVAARTRRRAPCAVLTVREARPA